MNDNNNTNGFIEIIKNYDYIISFTGSLFTIFAAIIALYAIGTWRKQQKYSIQINLLMDLEDNYEILFTKYIEEFHLILKLQNTIYVNKTENYQNISEKELNKVILNEYNKKKLNDDLVNNRRKYEIAHLRAKRLFLVIDSSKSLKLSYFDKIFDKHINKIELTLSQESNAENIFKEYAEEFLGIKDNAIKLLTALREKL